MKRKPPINEPEIVPIKVGVESFGAIAFPINAPPILGMAVTTPPATIDVITSLSIWLRAFLTATSTTSMNLSLISSP